MGKIDIHAHYLPEIYRNTLLENGVNAQAVPLWSEESQLAFMNEYGIDYSILSLSAPHFHFHDIDETAALARKINEFGAMLHEKFPGRFGFASVLPFPDIQMCVKEIEYSAVHLKNRIFGMLTNYEGVYLGDDSIVPIYEKLNEIGAVVILHPADPVPANNNIKLNSALMDYFFDTTRAVTNMIVNGTILKYSNIKFVIPHGGALLTVLSDRLSVLSKAIGMKDMKVEQCLQSLYYDLAGVSMPKQYDLLLETTDTTHLLYGTDYPYTPNQLYSAFLEAMEEKIPDQYKKMIYSENAKALIHF
ncbi:MAG: amidohydrolase family protein [Lachnospiraceae bacterium]|nr:amidohydrolase family protein [Lachnospiraceae bacterium]